MNNSFRLLLACWLMLSSLSPNAAQDIQLDSTLLTARDVATGIQVPWEVLWGVDDHLWVTERRGRILRIEPESGNTTTVLDYEEEVLEQTSEYGMLGMALHPSFLDTPQVFVVYCYSSGGDVAERLSRFSWNGEMLEDEVVILNDIPGGGIHNGSRLLFTDDGKLLMTVGDRGRANLAQDINSINGKTLRLNIDGSIPSDNPDPNSLVYSYGHRNQQGLAYGPNRQLYASEHGPSQSDEINLLEPMRNYGWPEVQGVCNTSSEQAFCEANDVAEPLWEWTPCVAVNGIAYYDHPAIPEWEGKMLMAILGGFVRQPRLAVLTFGADGTTITAEDQYLTDLGRLRDVAINPHTGAVYVATNGASYPGFGPNRIIEYRNLAYQPSADTELSTSLMQLALFPNPTTAFLEIQTSNDLAHTHFTVLNARGQVVQHDQLQGNHQQVDVSSWASGMYFVRLEHDKGVLSRTFVVE